MHDDDLDEEVRVHLEIETEERIAGGMNRTDAEAAARRAFGSVAFFKEATREQWAWRGLERAAQDVRYALRLLRRSPGFTGAVLVSVALGVGAQTAVFSVVNAVLLRPLSFPHADRLVAITERPSAGAAPEPTVSGPDFADYHDQSRSLERVAAYLDFTFPLTDTDTPILVQCTAISPDFFDALGIRPLLGRVYTAEEYHQDGGHVIIGYGFWQRHFGGDPHALGRTIYLNHGASEIIGVMPPVADIFSRTDVWATYVPDFVWARQRDNRFLSVIGLLQPGVEPIQAQQELEAIYRRMPAVGGDATVTVTPLKDQLVGGVRPALVALLGAVGLVLLIACANVGNLLLARGAARRREIATRYALGATRSRLIRQFLTESLLLSAIGGVAGVLLASELVNLFTTVNPVALPRLDGVALDGRVLTFAVAVSIASALIFSAAPVMVASRERLHDGVKGRGTPRPRDRRMRGVLVAAEVTIAVVLLTGAGLLGRSFWRVLTVMPGFRADHVLTLRLRVPDQRVATSFYPDLLERIARRTGVDAVAVSDCMPTGFLSSADLLVPGRSRDPADVPTADACFVSDGYFRALGIPLVAGRPFDTRDREATAPVAIVSDAVARRLWPGRSAIGQQLAVNYKSLGRPTEEAPVTRVVVGIVGDVRQRSLETPPQAAVYLPYEQDATRRSLRAMVLFARTAAEPDAMTRAIQDDVRAFAPDVPVQLASTLETAIHQSLALRTFSLALLAAFAAFAIILAAAGLYGVVAYAVALRTREIAIHMALGAQHFELLCRILGYELRWVLVGFAAGAIGALIAGRLLRGMLFGITPADPWTFAAVVAVLALVATAACWSPAHRAIRTNPLAALREE